MSANIFKDSKTYKALFAEFLGTLLLTFFGVGSGATWGHGASVLHVAVAVGLIIASLVQTLGHVSGCHINPSVTVGMLITRKINIVLGFLYIIVQCVGATVGIYLLKSVTPGSIQKDLGVTLPSEDITPMEACTVEILATFFFVVTIFGVCDDRRTDVKGSAPLAIGLAATAVCLVAAKFTRSSLNPARSFGPALAAGNWRLHWVYWVGPCVGGALAGLIYEFVLKAEEPRPTPKNRDHDYEMCAKGDH